MVSIPCLEAYVVMEVITIITACCVYRGGLFKCGTNYYYYGLLYNNFHLCAEVTLSDQREVIHEVRQLCQQRLRVCSTFGRTTAHAHAHMWFGILLNPLQIMEGVKYVITVFANNVHMANEIMEWFTPYGDSSKKNQMLHSTFFDA